jgi:DNA-binding CsgD family transcriptional regulator
MASTRKRAVKQIFKDPRKLSNRELNILSLICKEFSPGEIGRRLTISTKTYFNHRANILAKTKAKTNVGLLKYALRHGHAKL